MLSPMTATRKEAPTPGSRRPVSIGHAPLSSRFYSPVTFATSVLGGSYPERRTLLLHFPGENDTVETFPADGPVFFPPSRPGGVASCERERGTQAAGGSVQLSQEQRSPHIWPVLTGVSGQAEAGQVHTYSTFLNQICSFLSPVSSFLKDA